MPQPREFKDPLWPEPTPDLWMGRKPLAPWSQPLPPLPPEPKPTELEPYIVDPDNRPAQPPKGRPETGQPVGPMFTKLPRQDQRGAVDKTFNDLVTGARGIQGSVFDTAFDKALRFGVSDTMGGLGPTPAIVANPEHLLFRQLTKRMPKLAGSLQKMRPTTEYASKPIMEMPRAWGVTSVMPNELVQQAALRGQFVKAGQGVTQEEVQRLANRGVSASLQSFPKGRVADETLAHEGYHALFSGKNPIGQAPRLEPQRAFQLISRVMRRAGASDEEIANLMRQYGNDPAHGLVDALARYQTKKTGGMSVIR